MKFFLIFLFIFFFPILSFAATISQDDGYYIKEVEGMKFFCLSKDNCYNATPERIKLKNKVLIGFGGYHYYDLTTYKYDKTLDIYNVDIVIDRDPSTDCGYYSPSPYDDGNITHVIFSIQYSPSKNIFNSQYKGFITSKTNLKYQNGKPSIMHTEYLNIYYDRNPKLITELNQILEYFNQIKDTIVQPDSNSLYDIEISKIIPMYL